MKNLIKIAGSVMVGIAVALMVVMVSLAILVAPEVLSEWAHPQTALFIVVGGLIVGVFAAIAAYQRDRSGQ